MIPQTVHNLDDYIRWYTKLLRDLGADVHGQPLHAYELPLSTFLDGREQRGVRLDEYEVILPKGQRFDASADVVSLTSIDRANVDFEHLSYSYGLREADGTWIWRFDKHDEEDHHNLGQPEHAHWGPPETPAAHHEMDLGDVVYELKKD